VQQDITRRTLVASAMAATAESASARHLLAAASWPKVADHALTVVTGNPRERGRRYGKQFGAAMARFLDHEIVTPFSVKVKRDDLLRYAGQCANEIRAKCGPSMPCSSTRPLAKSW
jgi:hypothetical protein